MSKFKRIAFLICGLLLTLAAFPVFAQEDVKEIQLNKMPLNDFAKFLNEKIDRKEVDLTKPFSVQLEGVLDKDGKLDAKKSKFIKSEGDEMMIEIGKNFIEAINSIGIFIYLKQMGIENIKFNIGQDDRRTYAVINSEMPNAQKAKTISSGMNMVIKMVKTVNKDGDGIILINAATVETTDKTVVIKMDGEKSIVQEMINRKLKESRAKEPSGK